jgi:hypothetical protein
MVVKMSFGLVHAYTGQGSWSVYAGARGKLHEHDLASSGKTTTRGDRCAEGARDRQSGRCAQWTGTDAYGSAMLTRPGRQLWFRHTSDRWLSAVAAQARAAKGSA